MSPVTSSIGSVLTRWVRLVLRFRIAVIVLFALVSVWCAQYAATRLGINTDTADMISPELPWRQDFIDFRRSFESRDRNLVVVVTAEDAERRDAFATALTQRLAEHADLYPSVFDAEGGEFFARNGLLYLTVDELEALADRLAAAQPLLGLLRPAFNGATVVGAATRSLGESSSAGEPVADALYAELASAVAAALDAKRDPIAWRALVTGVEETGPARRLILVRPQLDFERVQPAAAAITNLDAEIAALQSAGFGDVDASLTGSVAMEYEEMLSVRRGAGLAGIASLLMVGLVMYAALRSFRLLALSLATLLVGLTGTAAFAAAAVGHLNLLSVAFAVLYIGLGVDFILHVTLRCKELLAEGSSVDDAVTATIGGVGTSLVVCAVTTAAGFFAFIPTAFQGVSELGLISGTGMFLSLATSVTLLPALLATFLTQRDGNLPPALFRGVALHALAARPRAVLSVTAVLVVVACMLLPRLEFDNNPINLRDPDTESVRAIAALAADGDAPLFDLVAVAPDGATARDWAAALRELPVVESVATAAALVPEQQDEKLFVLEDIALLLGPGFAAVERAPPDPEKLEAELIALDTALRDTPAESVAGALAQTNARFLAALAGADASRRAAMLEALDAAIVARLPDELARLEAALGAERFELGALPAAVTERWLGDDMRELVEISPAEDVSDNAAARRFVDAVRDIVPSATGLPVVYQEASRTVVRSFRLALTYALIMVSILLWIFLLRLDDVVLVIVPILLAALVTAGVAVALGLPFNFANIIALPLLVGIGVDNGIHIVHRMRASPTADGTPYGTSTAVAMLASTLTTIASFGNLGFSSHRGMASMGQLLTIGMLVTLAATLLLLPVLQKTWGRQ